MGRRYGIYVSNHLFDIFGPHIAGDSVDVCGTDFVGSGDLKTCYRGSRKLLFYFSLPKKMTREHR